MAVKKKYVNEITGGNIGVITAIAAWGGAESKVIDPDTEYIIKTTIELFTRLEDWQNSLTYKEYLAVRNQIVDLNIMLVSTVLKKYKPYSQDVFQEGCIGLIKAVETYSLKRNIPFANYACACIENEIRMRYGYLRRKFENKVFLEFLDAEVNNVDDDDMKIMEFIEDAQAANDFMDLFSENFIQAVFSTVIIPSIDKIAKETRSALDAQLWKELELQYMVELTLHGNGRSSLTFTAMAKKLKTVTQNIRSRHERTMKLCRETFIALDFGDY